MEGELSGFIMLRGSFLRMLLVLGAVVLASPLPVPPSFFSLSTAGLSQVAG